MVNGDIDNCDTARCAAVDAITPARLGLPAHRCRFPRVCAGAVLAGVLVPTGRSDGRVRGWVAGGFVGFDQPAPPSALRAPSPTGGGREVWAWRCSRAGNHRLLPQAGEGGAQRRMRGIGAVRVLPAGMSRDCCPPSALRAPSPAGGGREVLAWRCSSAGNHHLLPHAGEGGAQRRMRGVGALRVLPAGMSRDCCPPSALRAPSPAGGGREVLAWRCSSAGNHRLLPHAGEGGAQRRMRGIGAVRVSPAGMSRDCCPPSALRAPSPAGGGRELVGQTQRRSLLFVRRRQDDAVGVDGELAGHQDRLGAVGHAELAQDRGDMRLDGGF